MHLLHKLTAAQLEWLRFTAVCLNTDDWLSFLISAGLIHREEDEAKKEPTAVETEAEAEVEKPPAKSLAARLGLTDWKVTAPIGLAIAIPTLSEGVSRFALWKET